MTKEEWLQEFDNRYPNFIWIISKYFPKVIKIFEELREEGRAERLFTILNDMWFVLPDSKFNIIENPPGWSDFLFLLENPFEK